MKHVRANERQVDGTPNLLKSLMCKSRTCESTSPKSSFALAESDKSKMVQGASFHVLTSLLRTFSPYQTAQQGSHQNLSAIHSSSGAMAGDPPADCGLVQMAFAFASSFCFFLCFFFA